MHGLEIELLDRLRRHEAPSRTLYRFGNRLGVSEHGRSIPLAEVPYAPWASPVNEPTEGVNLAAHPVLIGPTRNRVNLNSLVRQLH
jgi:hypothetical protein